MHVWIISNFKTCKGTYQTYNGSMPQKCSLQVAGSPVCFPMNGAHSALTPAMAVELPAPGPAAVHLEHTALGPSVRT